MGQPKVIVALVVALLLAVGAFVAFSPVVGLLVLVLGAGAVFFLLRQEGAPAARPRRGRDQEFLEADDAPVAEDTSLSATPLSTWAPETTDAEPLSAWSPGTLDAEPLSAWSPDTVEAEPLEAWDADTLDTLDTWDTETLETWESEPLTTWDEAPTEVAAEPVVDEAEEIAFASSLISSPINEDVASADDIMAASEATELHIAGEEESGGEDSELARLLAKVQARLAAYE